jgi:hypothetical protein
MKLSEQEVELIQTIRERSLARDQIRFTAAFEDGVVIVPTPQQSEKLRGVGTSFAEAFNNLDFKDVEDI